jgi:hypothetical protein
MGERLKSASKTSEAAKAELQSHDSKPPVARPAGSTHEYGLHLQRTIGNQAVQELYKSGVLQAKLKIGQPHDIYEQEADRVAEQVMRMPNPGCPECKEEELVQTKLLAGWITPLVQRQLEEEEEELQAKLADEPKLQRQVEEEEEELQAKPVDGGARSVSSVVTSQIQSLKGGGQPLPHSERAFFEPRFGRDFSGVRIHTDRKAAEAARAVNSRAFTTGRDVVFGEGQHAPGTTGGRKLLGHELTHVVQQNGNCHFAVANATRTVPMDPYTKKSDITVERPAGGKIPKIAMNAPSTTVLRQAQPVELSEPELQAEINRLNARLYLIFPGSPEWMDLLDRIDALQQELIDRFLTTKYTGVTDLEITNPLHDDVLYIDATSHMPAILCHVRVLGIQPDPTPIIPFDWQLVLTETVQNGGCPSARIGVCTTTRSDMRVVGGTWQPNFGNTIQGGDAQLSVSATVHGQRLTARACTLHIRGTNPTTAAISTRLGGRGTDADRIACRESRRRQFTPAGMPLLGRGGDTGIMQLCSPEATCQQRWNWMANVDQGIALFGRKRAAARRYLNTHQVNGHYPNDQGLNDADVLRYEAIKKYNGGRYWAWNSRTNQWETNPRPANGYVGNVLRCI